MADIHFEIFDNADFGNKNLRFSEAPAQEQRDFLKQNGYSFTSRYGGVWYPRTQEAKDRNADFVKEFAEKFYPENNKFQSQKQIDHLAEQALENSSAEIKSSSDDRIAYLENLIAELQEERKRDLEKISRLEAALENQNEENSAEIEMQQEQAALDDEAEWEKENTLTEAEEKAYIEKPFETEIPSETIELTSEMLDTLHESAEKEALEEEPQAEKEILHAAEKSDDDLTVSPEDLAIAKSVLPAVQYVSTLKFAQGEEREFFVHKIKEISAAVENAPKIGGTDGLEEHRIVLRYFHPSGTQSFITEIGKDGDAFGFQCLNDDWENAEWGYLNLDELKNIRGMEVDFHVPAGMTVEKFIQKERLEQYSEENVTAEAPKETRITWNDILQAAEGSHWNDEENAVYNNARNQIAEYAKKLGVDIESSESPEEAAETFAAAHEEISFSEDGSLVIDESLKPVYFNDLSDEQKEEVINGYRSADDQQMLEAWQKELENSYEFDKDIATNPPTDEWISNYLSEIKADFNTGYWHDIFSDLEKEENHEKTISDLSATEVSRLSEEKYGFYFEYSDDENVADIYSAKDGDFVGSYGEGGFGYADDLSGNDPVTKIPDENLREVLELAEIFYHKKTDEYENLVEAENGQIMTFAEAHEWNEEQKMQRSQEEDERDAEKADKDFEITKRLDEIVSEIKKSDFTLESKYENGLHSAALKNKDGKEIFSAKENDNVVIPVEHTISAWANDEASEKAKILADEFFNLVCDDGIRGGDYVNAVFKREVPVEEDYETDLSESNISYTAENYYQVNEHFAIEIVPADSPLSSGKMGDDWTVRFYDIKDSEKIGEKGQFVTSYYASTLLEHGKGAGLSLQGDVPAWTLDAETMDYVHDITFMWVDRHSSVQQKEDTEISQEEIEQEKSFVQNRIQQLKDELNNPENADDEQQNSEAKKNIENLECLTDDDIKKQVLWRKENQKRKQEAHNQVVEQMMEEKLRNKTPQEGELLSYNEKNPAYSVANKETKRETSIRPNGRLDENVKKLGRLKNISEANEIIGKIKSSGFDILSTENRIIIFDENKYYDFNAYADSGYFNYETKKFEFDLDRRNLNEWDFREYVKNGLKITKRMKDFAKIERMQNRKDYSLEEYWRNSISGMTMQDVKDGKVHIIDIDKKGTENSAPRTKSSQKKIREQCREILKKPDSEITEDDKKILAQYEGGGGLDENNRTNSEVLNAFYTPDNLIEKVWNLVDAYAPDAKSVLEPSAGVGRFAENRPDNEFTMHELDETSARINKILHPEADVIQGAFQKQFLDDGERFLKIGYEQPKYDVVIGNPPYGKYNDKYKGLGEGREFDRYEEYFIARGLDALKDEKSVLAFVVPSGFLSTASDKQKEIIASKGEILDAYRLPEGTFSTTKVGTDILIMRKKEGIDRKNISGELLSNGEWFKNHPEKVLGEIKTRTNRFGNEDKYVAVHEGLSVQDELNKIDIFVDEITEKNKSKKSFETQLDEYNRKYWGAVGQGDTRYDVSPVTEERLSEIKNLSKELSEYFENGIRPENDRFVIGKTPRVLQETRSEYTDVTVAVSVIKKAVETHGLSEEEILNALTRLATPILVFDYDKAATENKADSKLVLTDVFKDEKPVALAVNTNSTVDINNRGLTVEIQDIRSIHDRTLVAKNGTDLIQKWTNDGLCRYVDDKKISEWSTVARVQFPIELLQSDNSNILTRTALVNMISAEEKKSIKMAETRKMTDDEQLIFEDLNGLEKNEDLILPKFSRVKIYNPEKYGLPKDDKVHVLAQYESGEREDSVFNQLNSKDSALEFKGKVIDWNPISEKFSGTVEQYLEKLEQSKAEEKLKNLTSMPLEFDFSSAEEKKELPFDIINNEAKGRVNIRFNPAKQNPYFSDILKELKANKWKYAPSTRQWYPVNVEGSREFAQRLQEKYSSALNEVSVEKENFSSKEDVSVEKFSELDDIIYFDRNYNEAVDFTEYLNKNILQLKAGVKKVELSEAKTILKALNHENTGFINQRRDRLGLDKDKNLVIVSRESGNVEAKKTDLNGLIRTAKEMAEKTLKESKICLEKYNKKQPIYEQEIKDIFVNLWESCVEQSACVAADMAKVYEKYYRQPELKRSKAVVRPLEEGDKVGKSTVADLFQISNGVYQAALAEEAGDGVLAVQSYFVVDENIASNLRPELIGLMEKHDSRYVIETKRNEPYILKELISKGLMPPRDNDFVQKLDGYIALHPEKYAKLYPITSFNFAMKLKELSEIDNESRNDAFLLGKQLMSMVEEDDKKRVGKWIIEQGGTSEEAMRNLFQGWISGKEMKKNSPEKQLKKDGGYPPRGGL